MTRRDDWSRTEADARHAADTIGRDEWIGGDVGDQEEDPTWHKPLGPDPWEPFTCQRCGSVNSDGMPRKCDGCGLVNYGFGDDA